MAAGFLSEHMFPDTDIITAPVSLSRSLQMASVAIVAMFIPMASPVSYRHLRYRLLPLGYTSILCSLPWDVVSATAPWILSMLASIHSTTFLPCSIPSTLRTGARVM